MREDNQWNRFESSGKVEDYLEYKGCIDHAAQGTNVVPSGPDTASGVLLMEANDVRCGHTHGNCARGITNERI